MASDDAILHLIQDSRSNAAGARLLGDFKGVLVTDGYVVYESKARDLGYVQAHCWSHARRKFIEAEASAPDEAAAFLDDIGELVGIEREIEESAKSRDSWKSSCSRTNRTARCEPTVRISSDFS